MVFSGTCQDYWGLFSSCQPVQLVWKVLVVHLQFVPRYAPPLCNAVPHWLLSFGEKETPQYASYLYRSTPSICTGITFEKIPGFGGSGEFLNYPSHKFGTKGTHLVARAIRNAIRANRFARIIRNWNPYFYSESGRFARITRISDSRESPDSRESCESIRANHATKGHSLCTGTKRLNTCPDNPYPLN